jgi:hypothetical protein
MSNWAESILSPLKSASGLLQEAIEVRDTVKFGDVVIKLQAQIMAAQQGAMAAQSDQAQMIESISELKEKVARLEAWDAQKKRYKMKEVALGVLAYALQEGMESGEPVHHICAACYQRREISVLQSEFWQPNRSEVLVCHGCGSVLYIQGNPDPEHKALRPVVRR